MAQMGRPRTFDRQQAIRQAMQLFWEQGYESTSLAQLKACMGGGISAPSFYAAFGSKEALFEEVVQCYVENYARVTDCLWDDGIPPRDAVELALRRSAKMQCEPGHPKGCMVALGVMSAPTPEHAHVAKPLAVSRARTFAGFIRCVERGIAMGELAEDANARAIGNAFNSFLLGVSISIRDGVKLPTINASITQMMTLWDTCKSQPVG
ncbi:TetR/AcrR family transcriptional regulator [Pseudomonas aeruginosa]|nr:TetR/AcrR family transcriptional regulator [Pseudomonas aeruginosa]QDJ39468.1 TetR family transcriptional regulator [Bordetella hinzii]MBN7865794.1 TetR/AcrR family transcriptional regulator [Pseudomonas aeruginosa]RCN12840.1 Copper outer membrane regulator [Pseudomonas aeruginosa]WJM50900.1 TetR/AcrR family transcriptional regulator [Pseudomonas aeruginosa]HBO0810584.1 TetR/AcrR family transcriptional regulator [Pseudomonas aeruginosa]